MAMTLVSLVSLVVLNFPSRGLTQTTSYPVACDSYAQSAYNAYTLASSNDTSDFCASNGAFSNALKSLSSCVDAKPTGLSMGIGSIQTPISICSSKSLSAESLQWAFTSSVCCGSDEGAKLIGNCPVQTSLASLCTFLATDTASAWMFWGGPGGSGGGRPNFPFPFGASSTPTATSGTQTSGAQNSGAQNSTQNATPASKTNLGLIIGASVGVTLGVILLCATIAFFIYRRHQHQKETRFPSRASRDSEAYGFARELGPGEEKAQLHSQNRQEIASSPVPYYVKNANGREELSGDTLAKMRIHAGQWELPANETVGSEVDSEATEVRGGSAIGHDKVKSTASASTGVSSDK